MFPARALALALALSGLAACKILDQDRSLVAEAVVSSARRDEMTALEDFLNRNASEHRLSRNLRVALTLRETQNDEVLAVKIAEEPVTFRSGSEVTALVVENRGSNEGWIDLLPGQTQVRFATLCLFRTFLLGPKNAQARTSMWTRPIRDPWELRLTTTILSMGGVTWVPTPEDSQAHIDACRSRYEMDFAQEARETLARATANLAIDPPRQPCRRTRRSPSATRSDAACRSWQALLNPKIHPTGNARCIPESGARFGSGYCELRARRGDPTVALRSGTGKLHGHPEHAGRAYYPVSQRGRKLLMCDETLGHVAVFSEGRDSLDHVDAHCQPAVVPRSAKRPGNQRFHFR